MRPRHARAPARSTLEKRVQLTKLLTWGRCDKFTAEGLAHTTGLSVEECNTELLRAQMRESAR